MKANGRSSGKGTYDLTQGGIVRTLTAFTWPMMMGSLLQQAYNLSDLAVVGRFVGPDALAAVGAAYALLVLLTSVVQGLSMGSGTVFSHLFGAGQWQMLRQSVFVAFVTVGGVAVLVALCCGWWLSLILEALQVPSAIFSSLRGYLQIVLGGFFFVFLYNFLAAVLRSVGDSVRPLWFLGVSVLLNVILDVLFVAVLGWGLAGAAWATVVAQAVASLGLLAYVWRRCGMLRLRRCDMRLRCGLLREIVSYSALTCMQQSVMNFGILLIQGLVNSFGTVVMAAFAVAVKIDTFAYMPVQEFGNAYSIFAAQNYGAGCVERIRNGFRSAVVLASAFSLLVSAMVCAAACPLMQLFVGGAEDAVVEVGVTYLHIEGAFYVGIGILFLLYGHYRAVGMPLFSVVLTIVSLGTRVLLAYTLASDEAFGICAVWWSIPIGWFLADLLGFLFYNRSVKRLTCVKR